MTASLLARKGSAAPSLATLPVRPSAFGDEAPPYPPPPPREFPPEIAPVAARDQAPAATPPSPSRAPTTPDQGDKPRRIVVTLSNEEFERLCIAAVKKDTTRHKIVHTALEQYYQQLAAELPRRCACMAEGGCCA